MGQKCETGKYEARDQKMLLHLMIPQTRQVYTLYIFYNAGCECCSEGIRMAFKLDFSHPSVNATHSLLCSAGKAHHTAHLQSP